MKQGDKHPVGERYIDRTEAPVRASGRLTLILLALSLLLLVGAAVYGLFNDYRNMLEREGKATANLADGVQVYVTEMLRQSLFSLEGVAKDLEGAGDSATADRLAALRGAMRYDPASAVLGLRTAHDVLMVDGSGKRLDWPALKAALDTALTANSERKLAVLPVIYVAELHDWYLPVQLDLAARVRGVDAAFALIAARKLVEASASVRLLPGAYLSVVNPDGYRLFQYYVDTQEIKGDQGRVSPGSLAQLRSGKLDSFQAVSSLTGRPTLFGISMSKQLPLAVSVGIQLDVLEQAWLRRSLGQMLLVLVTSISGIYFALRLMTASRKERDYLRRQEYLANHDSLTGLLNRYAFQRRLRQCLDEAQPQPLVVLLLGLNRFKEINDTLGHLAGDVALAEVARRMQAAFGTEAGFVARLSGDEIAVAAPLRACAGGVDGLCASVAAVIGSGITVDGIALELDASVGAAVFPDDARTPSDLLRCADIAMYAAKRDMRSHERYTEAMDHYTAASLAMKTDLSQALREGGLSLAYQPKVDLASGALVGVEALSRWVHPDKGAVSPAVFIPLVETTELIHPFTRHVMGEAVVQCRRWLDAGHRVPVAVNISVNNLMDASFVDMVRALLAQHAVPAGLLELELTEGALMRNPETALRRLAELRALGLKLSIDDFGTGYASLAYLKKLPVDSLKIDKSFILGLAGDEADKRIVRSTIQLAHSFGMVVVAEGVETQEVADLLRKKGCDLVQGYLYARPLPAADLAAQWLEVVTDTGG
ncbi:bifunctional diguanylate cyclase/phosphodiesterase [Duganella sp. HH105]|uniref:putative bifunctional diguanylate cyclase/phosphodiesterase n=1 Tax=Duganella sp. HH105 TaxID=1781067 RepID=UPI000877B9AA|nr:EAL domain-containing protein [Duganella sp. HH105]OEZ55907.1 phytochrome-like protein cph2 [Duganella sp. HH105]